MKNKVHNIWDFISILEKNIEKYAVKENFFKDGNAYIFDCGNYKLKILENEIYIDNKKISKKIDIVEKNGIFGQKFYLNSVEVKNNGQFIYKILNEWKDIQETVIEVSEKHILICLEKSKRERYLKCLNTVLETLSFFKVKKDKYIFLVGYSLDVDEEKIIDILQEREESIKIGKLDSELYRYLYMDFFNYCYVNKFRYMEFKEIINIYPELKLEEKYYKVLLKIFKKKGKLLKFSNDRIKKIDEEFHYKFRIQDIFYSSAASVSLAKEKKKMNEILKIDFMRDGQDYYYYKFIGNSDDKLEYLSGLQEEDNALVRFALGENVSEIDNNEGLDFNEVLNSKNDNDVKAELSKKSSMFKKYLREREIVENTYFEFPKVIYSDITEEIVLGYMRIKKDTLYTNGIWAYQGKRHLEINFENLKSKLLEKDNLSLEFSLVLKGCGNKNVDDEMDISTLTSNYRNKDDETNDLIVSFPLDTSYLGNKYIVDKEENYVNLEFYFELKIRDNDIEQEHILGIPVKIRLLNPEYKDYNTNEIAAIDFGTSSTCIAVNNSSAQRVLISLEEPDKIGKQAYENPTNLLIKNWESFYELWKERENNIPIILKSEDNNSDGLYNQGYSLKEQLKQATKSELNAQINQLKLIPYKILTLNDKVKLIPQNIPKVGIKEVELVCDYKIQDKEKFDIISFYGYLLGRAVLSPFNGKLFKRFYVTVPVKFEKNVKEVIIESLKNGIKLATPEPLRDKITVEEGYEEPVAFIGAACNHKSLENWNTNSKFAVFDFGGGTLDFAFGKYRKPINDDEADEYDRIIEIINTSGDEKGGAEYMIHRLSYQIYIQNQEEMKKSRIPFVIPSGENEIELFPQDLQRGKTREAILNVNKINEDISRKIFEGTLEENGFDSQIELSNEEGIPQLVQLSIEKDFLTELLKGFIRVQVENFRKLIEENFANEVSIYENLHIFRGGNASRSELLKEILYELFPEIEENYIHFIDEDSVHGLKPKTAVALGELKLRSRNEIGIVFNNKSDSNEVPFEFNVGYIDVDKEDEFIEYIKVGDTNKKWTKLCRAGRDSLEFTIYYTKSIGIKEINNPMMQIFRQKITSEDLENGNTVWLRAISANKLEYILSKREPEDSVTGKLIELPRY